MQGTVRLGSPAIDVRIRPARLADLPALPAIESSAAAAFRGTGHDGVADEAASDWRSYVPFVRKGLLWAAEYSGGVAGFAAACVVPDAMHVQELAVALPHQRNGIGTRLMQAVIEATRAAGVPAVTLTTFEDVIFNAPFYEALGFSVVGSPSLRLRAVLAEEAARGLFGRCAMRLAL
jgi:GNAT superfamily N-acetyltransferase